MGEIAEDMVRGACCTLCGVYFEEDHGFPVLCKHCTKHTGVTEMKRLGYQEAGYKEMTK